MNLSTVALLLLGWQLLSGTNNRNDKEDFSPIQLLSDDNRSLLADISKLSDKTATTEQKTSAVLDLIGNPAVMSLAEKLIGKSTASNDDKPLVNNEGYNFGTPEKDCKECFSPVDNIADAEVKNKLYYWYDWYVK